MTLPASIRVNVKANFPALVNVSGFLTLSKANGVWNFGANFSQLSQYPGNVPTSTAIIALQDSSGAYFSITVAALLAAFSSQFGASLPTSLPSTAGVVWNNGGVVSIS